MMKKRKYAHMAYIVKGGASMDLIKRKCQDCPHATQAFSSEKLKFCKIQELLKRDNGGCSEYEYELVEAYKKAFGKETRQ